ncbi:MAG: sugar phosphate isomerase/epimerase [Victivallaceae bacterium]|nr:sugar phosphate isomerase/epimerase [Victivallaceae bacterium]
MKYYTALNYWVLGGFAGELSPQDAILAVKAMGLDGIEFTFGDSLDEDITQNECEAIATFAAAQGVGLRSLATGSYWGCAFGTDNVEERNRAIAFTEKYLHVAAWLGAEHILVVPGAVDVAWDESRPVVPYETVWDNATSALKELLPLAESLKVNICLENVWNKFLLSPMEMKLFIDQFDSEYIGSYFDIGNALLNGYPEHWIELLGSRIKAVHFKNFSREDCGGGIHGFGDDLISGDIDFTKVIAALNSINFTGPISAEMIPFCRLPDLVLPDEALARDTAEKLIAILKQDTVN